MFTDLQMLTNLCFHKIVYRLTLTYLCLQTYVSRVMFTDSYLQRYINLILFHYPVKRLQT